MPGTVSRLLIDLLDKVLVDFDEGLMRERAAGLGVGGLGHLTNGKCLRLKLLKRVVQFLLGGTLDQIETMQNEIGKSQRTLAGESCFVATMTIEELGRVNEFVYVGISVFKLDGGWSLW
jgi:hypothetical protein